ncbi:hypothetical protein [Streptomyces phaeolivaceus]|uniref:hypothetical protein n=1 Tax=Streptomyces phaeolivaceus TaxID=2653200 RepID=UPI001D046A9A|nr:hypothetical protein [Streptomyces phaeolivaceus]
MPALTPAAALPGAGAVLRVVRVAAGRRSLRVALLVGGLFVLGVLCGTRANAAEGTPTSSPLLPAVTDTATGVTGVVPTVAGDIVRPVKENVVRPVKENVVRPVKGNVVRPVKGNVVRPVKEDVVRPVTEKVVRPVTEHVVVPVGDLVESVTEGLGGVSSQLPPVSGLPSLPEVPGLPQLPEMPGWNTSPVETPPVVATPLEPGRAEAERPGPPVDGDGRRDGERASGPAAETYGPYAVDGGAAPVVSAPRRDSGVGGPSVLRVPARQNPHGLPTGALGRHSAVDNNGPRHAEPHAVASFDRAPLSVLLGTPVADVPDGTRDRHRDIPEFPG